MFSNRHSSFHFILISCALVIGVATSSAPTGVLGKDPRRNEAARKSRPAASAIDVTATSSVRAFERSTCFQSRRKLWVEDDGWIVRRVTTCESARPSK